MPIIHIAVLAEQYRLQQMPRSMERFQEYINTLLNEGHTDADLVPLVAMNPMGREHITERVAEYLALDAEQIAANAVREAQNRLGIPKDNYKHGLVVMDDVKGGWTNRASAEMGSSASGATRNHWISTGLWASEPASAAYIRQTILHSIFRVFYVQIHGAAQTLSEYMQQEGRAMAFAGCIPHLDADDIAYTRQVIAPLMDTDNYPVCFAAMLGDEAARQMGYEPLGLSARAGFEVALIDALMEEPQ